MYEETPWHQQPKLLGLLMSGSFFDFVYKSYLIGVYSGDALPKSGAVILRLLSLQYRPSGG